MIDKVTQNMLFSETEIDTGRNNNEPMSDRDTELIARSLEFMFPLLLNIDMAGIELVKIIGYGQEKNNHDALISFIKKLDQKLLEIPSSDHLGYVKQQLEDIFEMNG